MYFEKVIRIVIVRRIIISIFISTATLRGSGVKRHFNNMNIIVSTQNRFHSGRFRLFFHTPNINNDISCAFQCSLQNNSLSIKTSNYGLFDWPNRWTMRHFRWKSENSWLTYSLGCFDCCFDCCLTVCYQRRCMTDKKKWIANGTLYFLSISILSSSSFYSYLFSFSFSFFLFFFLFFRCRCCRCGSSHEYGQR